MSYLNLIVELTRVRRGRRHHSAAGYQSGAKDLWGPAVRVSADEIRRRVPFNLVPAMLFRFRPAVG